MAGQQLYMHALLVFCRFYRDSYFFSQEVQCHPTFTDEEKFDKSIL